MSNISHASGRLSRTSTTRMTGSVLWGLRAAWAVFALLTFALFLIGIPNQLRILMDSPEFAPEVLAQVGMSAQMVAWYDLSLDLVQMAITFFMAVLLFARRSDDRMAVLTSLTLFTWGTTTTTGIITGLIRQNESLELPILLIQAIGQVLLLYFGITFPTGRFNPRWTLPIVVIYGIWQITSVLFPTLPISVESLPNTVPELIDLTLYVAIVFGVQVYRFRRVLTPTQVQQGKWVLYGMALAITGFIAVLLPRVIFKSLNDSNVPAFFYEMGLQTYLLFALSAIPVTMAFSILRHRLWDLDFIINRSLVYGALTVALGLAFMGSVLVFQALLEVTTGGKQSPIALTASAVVIGLLFNPVRGALRRLIDKRIFGIQFDYQPKPPPTNLLTDVHGATVGPCEILEPVGRGGMAEVYKARHLKLNHTVAVKMLAPHTVFDEEARERFEREARALAGLRHANIVQVYDFGQDNDVYYMVMEYIAGQDVGHLLETSGPLSVEQTCDLLVGIASALDYAHAQGIVHRDVKPTNVMLRANESGIHEPVLTDFGLARISQRTQATQDIIGTMDYIAPEQIRNVPDIDGRADVYALGVMVYQMLTGQLPFAAGNPAALLLAHIHQPPPDPRMLRPDLDSRVSAVLLRALAKDRSQRYTTAGEFAGALCDQG